MQQTDQQNTGKHKTGREVGSYFLVSFTQTFVEFGAFALLQLLKFAAPIPSAVSIFISGSWNYLLNRNLTFKSSANYAKSITQFILLYVWNFCFLSIMLQILPTHFGWDPMIVKLFTMGCQGVWGFLLCKFVIFRKA